MRRTMVDELPASLRALYRRVLVETLRSGVPVDPGALAVVLSAFDECADDPERITSAVIERLLWFEIAVFCERHNLEVPSGCSSALFACVAIAVGDDRTPVRIEDPKAVFGVLDQVSAVGTTSAKALVGG